MTKTIARAAALVALLCSVAVSATAQPKHILFLAGPRDHGAPGRHEYEKDLRALAAALETGEIVDAAVAQSQRETQAFWAIRDAIGEVTPTLQPMLGFDISLPTDAMGRFLAQVDSELARFRDPVTNLVFGHIGDSNLHLAVTTHKRDGLDELCDLVYDAVGAHGGSVSAEHGIGIVKREYLHHSRNPAELALMRRLKAALDPHGILSPGRVLTTAESNTA